MISCKYCGDPIVFKENVISERTYKQLPLNEFDGNIHRCTEGFNAWKESRKDKKIFCKYCLEVELKFDDLHMTPRGRHIPLEAATGEIHECSQRQHNPNTGRTTTVKGISR
jgi:DNA-directed RNA polymerase subunit RPC12/RpoP